MLLASVVMELAINPIKNTVLKYVGGMSLLPYYGHLMW